MASVPAARGRERARTRRWDAVVLGGALPGLVTAVTLGQHGARVLVLEEEAAARGFPGLREPFFSPGSERDSVLGACLRSLGIPLIDQRRVQLDPVALQVVLPEARVDAGEPALTASEWVAWGLAKPQLARTLARGLAEAADAERRALLAAPFVRLPRRLSLGALRGLPARRPLAPHVPEATPSGPRGLPAELAEAPPALAAVLEAQTRALSRLGAAAPTREARARLLGAPLEGGASIRGVPWLREILRQRVLSLYGEFRTLAGPFALVAVAGQPGVAPEGSEEVWTGRLLVLNAPLPALAAVAAPEGLHGILRSPGPTRHRLALHFRMSRRAVPEGMAPRVLRLRDPQAPPEGANLVTLRLFHGPGEADAVDLVASALAPADAPDAIALERTLVEAVTDLMPFAGHSLERVRAAAPRWDSDDWLCDPAPGVGWPAEIEVRTSAREPVYHLDRAAAASLGIEGDLLLGWRTGEAALADLA
jgi:hypothetical protein